MLHGFSLTAHTRRLYLLDSLYIGPKRSHGVQLEKIVRNIDGEYVADDIGKFAPFRIEQLRVTRDDRRLYLQFSHISAVTD